MWHVLLAACSGPCPMHQPLSFTQPTTKQPPLLQPSPNLQHSGMFCHLGMHSIDDMMNGRRLNVFRIYIPSKTPQHPIEDETAPLRVMFPWKLRPFSAVQRAAKIGWCAELIFHCSTLLSHDWFSWRFHLRRISPSSHQTRLCTESLLP